MKEMYNYELVKYHHSINKSINLEEPVLKMISEGFSMKYIAEYFGVSYNRISYIKHKKKKSKYKLSKKQKFKYSITQRVKKFQSRSEVTEPYSDLDVLDYLNKNPYCYISQEKIDIYDTKSWSLDHFVPVSKGGSSNLSNLRICKTKYNYMKWAMTFDEFVEACKKVIEIHG